MSCPPRRAIRPSLASALAAFYERAGPVMTLGGRRGSVTVDRRGVARPVGT